MSEAAVANSDSGGETTAIGQDLMAFALSAERRARTTGGIIERTVLNPSTTPVATTLKEIGTSYYNLTKDSPNHPYGPPQLNKGIALFEEIVKYQFLDEALVKTQAELAKWCKNVEHCIRGEIADVIRQCIAVEAKNKNDEGVILTRICVSHVRLSRGNHHVSASHGLQQAPL